MTDKYTISALLPEIMLIVLAVWIYVGGVFSEARGAWAGLALVTFVLAGIALIKQNADLWRHPEHLITETQFCSGPIILDGLSRCTRFLSLVLGALLVLAVLPARRSKLFVESLGSVVFMIAGLMLVSLAGDLVLLFVGLELISIPTYVLLFLGRDDRSSAEATAKYFFLSLLSSALLLYGFSMLYGLAGTTNLVDIYAFLSNGVTMSKLGVLPLMPFTVVLLLVGFGFKIASVPFHFYAPDVYQATTNTNAGLLAVVPKIAGIVGLVRILVVGIPIDSDFLWKLIVVLSMVTMTIGNVGALWQRNLRRMLAYSSIANSGYMLIGIAVALAAMQAGQTGAAGIAATLLFVALYAVGSLGSFLALASLDDETTDVATVSQITGLGKRHPLIAGILAICLFSLTGIPPLAGFWGKLLLFKSAIDVAFHESAMSSWFWTLAIVAATNATIAAVYYLRVVSAMFFQSPLESRSIQLTRNSSNVPHDSTNGLPSGNLGVVASAFICAILALACAFPGFIVGQATSAAESVVSRRFIRITDVTLTAGIAANVNNGNVNNANVNNGNAD